MKVSRICVVALAVLFGLSGTVMTASALDYPPILTEKVWHKKKGSKKLTNGENTGIGAMMKGCQQKFEAINWREFSAESLNLADRTRAGLEEWDKKTTRKYYKRAVKPAVNQCLKLARRADEISDILASQRGRRAKNYKKHVDKVAVAAQAFAMDVADHHIDIKRKSMPNVIEMIEQMEQLDRRLIDKLAATIPRAYAFIKKVKRDPTPKGVQAAGGWWTTGRDVGQNMLNIQIKARKGAVYNSDPNPAANAIQPWAKAERAGRSGSSQEDILRDLRDFEKAVKMVDKWLKAEQ